jgi:hypothetical protein
MRWIPNLVRVHGYKKLTKKFSEDDMSFHPGLRSRRVWCASFLLMLTVVLLSAVTLAQDVETPKYDIFLGYQWLHPGGAVPSPLGTFNAPIQYPLPDMGYGAGGAFTYNFKSFLGLEGDFGRNFNDNNSEMTVSVGPKLTWRTEDVNYFIHTLLSYNRLDVTGIPDANGIGAILGGGMDLKITRRIYWRAFEADWVYARQNYSSIVSSAFPDLRRVSLEDGVRLRTGIVLNFGYPPSATPTAACSVQPSEVLQGEPITATAAGANFNPKHTVNYTWSASGGKISGTGNTASIDTNGVAGGSYTVTAHITDPKMKKGGDATCSASFTVKEPPKNPPTMSCSASPNSLQAGGSATITCSCTSPDNVPVTVSAWTASSGTVSGSDNTGTLNTTGASPGTITVSATCTDSRGLNTQASTSVTVENPPPPPPQASKLTDCDFANMAKIKKPWRVDNECKGKLDDVAKNLQQNAENKLVIVGNAEPTEKRPNLAAERAVNSKAYLTSGEAQLGIDPSRIETRTGSAGTMSAEYWIVPAGATFSEAGTQPVDESMVKAVPDHPHAAPKKKAKPAAQQ